MKELAIGEEITIRMRCVEDSPYDDCRTCAAKDYHLCNPMLCHKDYRKDGKNVHFEFVED